MHRIVGYLQYRRKGINSLDERVNAFRGTSVCFYPLAVRNRQRLEIQAGIFPSSAKEHISNAARAGATHDREPPGEKSKLGPRGDQSSLPLLDLRGLASQKVTPGALPPTSGSLTTSSRRNATRTQSRQQDLFFLVYSLFTLEASCPPPNTHLFSCRYPQPAARIHLPPWPTLFPLP